MTQQIKKKRPKAVGMLSGGLDSTLAAKLMMDMGVDVTCLHFIFPWGIQKAKRVQKIAEDIQVQCEFLNVTYGFIDMIQNAKYGYGSGFNPCVDCRIYNLKIAKRYMEQIQADFVFTGEVLGQRPMSQMRQSIEIVEKKSGLEGRLLRPLCARLLDPTIPETVGLIDRNRLLDISDRSRKKQKELADYYKITNFIPTGGGCLLTEKDFAKRFKDLLRYGVRDFKDVISLQWGRHFRLSDQFKAIAGRDEKENDMLLYYANCEDYICEFEIESGPTVILKGSSPNQEMLQTAASLVQYYSRYRNNQPMDVLCWPSKEKAKAFKIKTCALAQNEVENFKT
ncbi:MAG: NFACT RNA binding domain-containing protein [Candidatus Omnitrophota bacterium]